MLESSDLSGSSPTWGQEVTVKMQCVLEDRTVVEKDSKLVFVIGEGDVNQVNTLKVPFLSDRWSMLLHCAILNFSNSVVTSQQHNHGKLCLSILIYC